jgi:rubredoxin
MTKENYDDGVNVTARDADFLDFDLAVDNKACKCPSCGSSKTEIVLSECGLMYDPKKGTIDRINILPDSFWDGKAYLRCNECGVEGWREGIVKIKEITAPTAEVSSAKTAVRP